MLAPMGPTTDVRRTALWVLAVQCLLALSWTLYALFLPGMLAQVGIDKQWFVYVLIADQVIFALCDWFAGVHADRIGLVWRRLGRVLTAIALLSSATLLAMPWVATTGQPVLLLAVIFVWAATSSALRAPVFALLGRVRESNTPKTRAGLVSMALAGVSLAGASGPYLTLLLKNVDPRLPIALSAISLAIAGLWALRAETVLPKPVPEADPDARDTRRRAWSLAGIVLVGGIGTQIIVTVVAPRLLNHWVGMDAVVWIAWFWVGFGLGLIPGRHVAAGGGALSKAAVALIVGTAALAIAQASAAMPVLIVGLVIAGAGWGVFSTVMFASAVAVSSGRATARGAGTASGLVFSALAVATVVRMLFVAAGYNKTPAADWLPAIAWIAASVLLVVVARTLWRAFRDAGSSPA